MSHHTGLFSHPLTKRKLFCVGISLLVFGAIAFTLPQETIDDVPMIQAGIIVNGLLLGFVITIIGHIRFHTVWKMKFHPIVRGALIGAFVHLDNTIYTWADQPLFWKTMAFAAVFGGLLDMFATQLYGDGKVLTEGVLDA